MRSAAYAQVLDGLGQRSAVVVIVSFGGMGKTSLAREVAARCLRPTQEAEGFDAAVWISDKDNPGATSLEKVLDRIARTLDYPGFIQFPLEEKQWEIEQVLRRQRVLLVVDNYETITDQALTAWLIRLAEPSKVLITTRENRRVFHESCWLVELGGMATSEAHMFIGQCLRMLKIGHAESDTAELQRLITITGGNPKAIKIALGCVKYEHQSLQHVIDELRAARGELFTDLFTRCWELLDKPARRALLALTLFPASASAEAWLATANIERAAFERALEQLTDLALVDVQQTTLDQPVRYALHPLVRAFAGQKLAERPHLVEQTQERWIGYFLDFVRRCDEAGWNAADDFDLAEHEIATIEAVIRRCNQARQWQRVVTLVLGTRVFWNTRGDLQTRLEFLGMAVRAAEALNDPHARIQLWAARIRTLCYKGDLQVALGDSNAAHDLLGALAQADPALVENLNEAQIRICIQCGDLAEVHALISANIASAVARGAAVQLRYRYHLAEYLYLAGRYDEAEARYTALLGASADEGEHRVVITAWLLLARIALARQQPELARQHLQWAYERAWNLKHRRFLAQINRAWADVSMQLGDMAHAQNALAIALDLFERLGMRHDVAETRAALARIDQLPAYALAASA